MYVSHLSHLFICRCISRRKPYIGHCARHRAGMSLFVQASLWSNDLESFNYIHRSGTSGLNSSYVFSFLSNSNNDSQRHYLSYIPKGVSKGRDQMEVSLSCLVVSLFKYFFLLPGVTSLIVT